MSIASASSIVKFHELPSGSVLHSYQPATRGDGLLRSISWSKDGKWLALVPHCGFAEIISVKDHVKLIHTVQAIEEPCCASFQNTTKKNIAIGTKNGEVVIYDIKSRNIKKRFPRTTSAINKVEFTVKDSHVVATSESGEAFLYNYAQNHLSGSFKIPRSKTISALRTNPLKRNYLVAGSDEGVVAVWDIHANKHKFFVGSHKAPVTAVGFSPVNADLIVSAGLDRQFCFYDVSANKCISNIFVENSITSVDFSSDGKFIVVGSQRGKIYVYDSKKFQQPVYSFLGHNHAVNHLLFRKSEDSESSFTITPDNIKDCANVENHETHESLDLPLEFGTVNHNESVKKMNSHSSVNVEDSFLEAIGLGKDNTPNSCKRNESLALFEQNKELAVHTPTYPSKVLQNKIYGANKNSLVASTPDMMPTVNDVPPTISPITKPSELSNVESKIELKDMEECIKSTIRNELKTVSEELKNDMKHHSYQILTQVRDMGYGLLMHMVKESIKLDNNFNNLQIYPDMCQSQKLYEENNFLKQKIAILEEEVALLKSNQYNKHF